MGRAGRKAALPNVVSSLVSDGGYPWSLEMTKEVDGYVELRTHQE